MDDSRRSLHPSLGSSKPTERQHLPSSPGTCQLPRSQEQFQLAALLRSAVVSSRSHHALGLLVFFRSYLWHVARSHHRGASTARFPDPPSQMPSLQRSDSVMR